MEEGLAEVTVEEIDALSEDLVERALNEMGAEWWWHYKLLQDGFLTKEEEWNEVSRRIDGYFQEDVADRQLDA